MAFRDEEIAAQSDYLRWNTKWLEVMIIVQIDILIRKEICMDLPVFKAEIQKL